MAKHKYIETPEELWNIFVKYAKQTKEKPILVEDYVGKDGNRVFRQKERPLTMEGFECYCLENESDVHHYFDNTDKRYEEYRTVCSRIRKSIKTDQIEGGMAGIYNPSITQRLNGLVEKTDNKNENTNIEIKANFGSPVIQSSQESSSDT